MTAQSVASALDCARFDAIAEYANLAASYWLSIREAATRGDKLTVETHCRQVSAVTRETFATVKTLGAGRTRHSMSAPNELTILRATWPDELRDAPCCAFLCRSRRRA